MACKILENFPDVDHDKGGKVSCCFAGNRNGGGICCRNKERISRMKSGNNTKGAGIYGRNRHEEAAVRFIRTV